MTARERAEQIQWVGKTAKELWDEIEQVITAAVEEEREACAEVAKMAYVEFNGKKIPATAARIAELIRQRCNKSDGGTK